MIIRKEKASGYTMIDNKYLENKNLSLKAKGLLTLMLSLPDTWKFNINGICLLCKENSYAINNAIKELKDNGYLEIEKTYGDNGRFIYEYYVIEDLDIQ